MHGGIWRDLLEQKGQHKAIASCWTEILFWIGLEVKCNEPEFLTAGIEICEQSKLSEGRHEMNSTQKDYLAGWLLLVLAQSLSLDTEKLWLVYHKSCLTFLMISSTMEGCFITERHVLQHLFLLLFFYLYTIPFSGENDSLFADKPDHKLQTVQIKINSD